MSPAPNLTTRIEHFRSPAVRDLAWAILSPTLIAAPDASQHTTPAWYEQAFLAIESHLHELDKDDSKLVQHLTTPATPRLGIWFERLWSYWLQHNGRYELLAANLQVKQDEKTRGEFDFIVRDSHADEIEHWELAIKFYLGIPPLHSANHWFGPNLQDRLDLKFQHLVERQLPLSQSHAGQQICAERGWTVKRRRLISKGRLYLPGMETESHPPLPKCIDTHALLGHWLTQQEFQRAARPFPAAAYRHLTKSEWMVSQARQSVSFSNILSQVQQSYPVQIQVEGWGEQALRLFVV
ncbi:MAG TPA: DUF1853 family protein, partial [Candidatus Kapabacteria bacterium]|nr:DUF1853 family protein [Candidatus Kapabacteria bacterium]